MHEHGELTGRLEGQLVQRLSIVTVKHHCLGDFLSNVYLGLTLLLLGNVVFSKSVILVNFFRNAFRHAFLPFIFLVELHFIIKITKVIFCVFIKVIIFLDLLNFLGRHQPFFSFLADKILID